MNWKSNFWDEKLNIESNFSKFSFLEEAKNQENVYKTYRYVCPLDDMCISQRKSDRKRWYLLDKVYEHMKTNHKDIPEPNNFRCPFLKCRSVFEKLSDLYTHVDNVHEDTKDGKNYFD